MFTDFLYICSGLNHHTKEYEFETTLPLFVDIKLFTVILISVPGSCILVPSIWGCLTFLSWVLHFALDDYSLVCVSVMPSCFSGSVFISATHVLQNSSLVLFWDFLFFSYSCCGSTAKKLAWQFFLAINLFFHNFAPSCLLCFRKYMIMLQLHHPMPFPLE